MFRLLESNFPQLQISQEWKKSIATCGIGLLGSALVVTCTERTVWFYFERMWWKLKRAATFLYGSSNEKKRKSQGTREMGGECRRLNHRMI